MQEFPSFGSTGMYSPYYFLKRISCSFRHFLTFFSLHFFSLLLIAPLVMSFLGLHPILEHGTAACCSATHNTALGSQRAVRTHSGWPDSSIHKAFSLQCSKRSPVHTKARAGPSMESSCTQMSRTSPNQKTSRALPRLVSFPFEPKLSLLSIITHQFYRYFFPQITGGRLRQWSVYGRRGLELV